MKKAENQTAQTENGMDYLRNQNEVAIIDIPEQLKETIEKKSNKHVYIHKQFLIPRVYTTALLTYVVFFILNIACNIILNAIFGVADDYTSTNQDKLENNLTSKNKGTKFFYIFYTCIGAPILEEFVFRSIIFKVINWSGKKVQEKLKFIGIIIRILAFLISSFLFAFAHFGLSFDVLIKEIRTFPSYFLMGLAFAFAYNRDNYILASILTHMLNNTVSTVLILVL